MYKAFTAKTLILISLLLSSCIKIKASQEPLPGINIPIGNINTQIQLVDAPELANSHKNNDLLSLHLINLSNKTIIFPNDFGVRIISQDGPKLDPIQNNIFLGNELNYLPTIGVYPTGLIVDTFPYMAGLAIPKIIRVIVVGHIEVVDGEQVGAYIDVKIIP